MPFERPTLSQLQKRVETDIKGGLGVTTVLRRSFIGVISRALAGLAHLLFGQLDFYSKQVFPDTAEVEFLDRWSQLWGVIRNEATFAELNITINFTGAGSVPVNSIFQRSDGAQYQLAAEVTALIAGNLAGVVVAIESGDDGNLADGEIISLLSPISNVTSDAAIASTSIEGEDRESDESLRSRLVNRLQLPPLGGSANDYVQTALGVAGVTRAWVIPLNRGVGTVDVTFVEDAETPIIPSAPKVAEVQAAIDVFKPVTADSIVFAPTEAAADLSITIKPNSASVQDAITAELKDLMAREAAPAGAYKSPSENHTGTIKLSDIRTAIGIAVGLDDYVITAINGGAVVNITPLTGEIVTLGTITWATLP